MPIRYWILAATLLLYGSVAGQEPRRPFRHAVHRELSCRTCHPAGEGHRIGRTWTPGDCSSCHHDPARALACQNCHDESGLPPARAVPVTLAPSVWPSPRDRDLPFDHAVHAAKACQDCHPGGGVASRTECVSCHGDHHRAEADCTRCHRPAEPDKHDLTVHLTCSGAGCHARVGDEASRPGVALRPVLTRPLCMMCHPEQKEHEPGGSCHNCHRIPEIRG